MPPTIPARVAGVPRALITPTNTARMVASKTANSIRWQALKAVADPIIGAAYDVNNINRCPNAALAYRIGGDIGHATGAINTLLGFVNEPTHGLWDLDSWFYARIFIYNVALTYDWLYDVMTPAQRLIVSTDLMNRLDQLWQETNKDTTAFVPNGPGGWNYFQGFGFTWIPAVVMHGDPAGAYNLNNPRADYPSGSGVDRPDFFYNLMYNVKFPVTRAYTDDNGRGGIFCESTNYDSIWRLAMQLRSHFTATGEDFINDPAFTFVKDAMKYRLHITSQDFTHHITWGGQPSSSEGSLIYYERERVLWCMETVNDPTIKGWCRHWLDQVDAAVSGAAAIHLYNNAADSWMEFMCYDENQAAIDYTLTEPKYFHGVGPDVWEEKSSWANDPESIQEWGFAGRTQYGHMDAAPNEWEMSVGSRPFLSSDRTFTSDGNYAFSPSLSGGMVLDYVPGVDLSGRQFKAVYGPPVTPPEEAEDRILLFNSLDEYGHVESAGAMGFNYVPAGGSENFDPVLNAFIRKRVRIGKVRWIYDRIDKLSSAKSPSIFYHTSSDWSIVGRVANFDNVPYSNTVPYKGRLTVVTPTNAVVAKEAVPYATYLASPPTRGRITIPAGNAIDSVLYNLQIDSIANAFADTPVEVVFSTNNMIGSRVGGWVVGFGKLSERVSAAISASLTGAPLTEWLLCNLPENTQASVVLSGDSSATLTPSTNAFGELRFQVPSGSHSIAVTFSGAILPDPPVMAAPTPGNNTVGLAFTNPTNDTNIYRSTDANGPFTLLHAHQAGGTYQDSTALNGTTYFYYATAISGGNESAPSNRVSATPIPNPSPPNPPANFTAVAGDGRVTLNADVQGSVSLFHFWRSNVSGSGYLEIGTNTTPNFVDLLVINGHKYYYVATAENANGLSNFSAEASATPQAVLVTIPRVPGLEEAVRDKLLSIIQGGIAGLNRLLTGIGAQPVQLTVSQVVLGDTMTLSRTRISIVAGGEDEVVTLQTRPLTLPLTRTSGYEEEVRTNLFFTCILTNCRKMIQSCRNRTVNGYA